ncbi:DUF2975 domain-containing protein [Eggerthella sinensis]|uniref:DUF2975 domain-containing protein n=1 Tax=Eggerthella sinensis TaxID=242230 RepID=UPI0022E4FCCB|nr:DUF2975 domain-containing protein [Eggerthella sinensis]
MDADAKETESSLIRTNKVCKFICALMKLVFVFVCIWWAIVIVVMIIALFDSNSINNVGYLSLPALVLYVLSCVVMAVTCVTLIKIFSDASKGCSPFTMVQVQRLRLMAIALLSYAILEFAITYCSSFARQDWVGPSIATVDLFAIVAAAVVFAFSFVFKYGVLLQELSDETL